MKTKLPYEPPRILYTEKMEARAVSCANGDDYTCGSGPIQS